MLVDSRIWCISCCELEPGVARMKMFLEPPSELGAIIRLLNQFPWAFKNTLEVLFWNAANSYMLDKVCL